MPAFPVDVPKSRVLRALLAPGFTLKRDARWAGIDRDAFLAAFEDS